MQLRGHSKNVEATYRKSGTTGCMARDRHRHSTGHFMLTVLSGLADVESNVIRTRTAESRGQA
jgi:hypothetical protein